MKICKVCQQEKSLEDFHKNGLGRGGVQRYRNACRECEIKKDLIDYYANHEERKRRASERRKRPDSIEWHRNYRLKTRFGITIEQYKIMADKQGWKCAICDQKTEEWLHVDHCHASSKIRELLCRSCNTAIGMLKEDVSLLKKATAYLEKHQ